MRIARSALLAGTAILFASPVQTPDYDIILRGGTVIDGTGAPKFVADVAVRGGRIVRVGDLGSSAKAATVIDVRGLMVAPGFINLHSHASPTALSTAVNMLTQGVTTELLNADGGGPIDIDGQFGPIQQNGLALNVAASIGFNAVWQTVVGASDRRPSTEEIERMRGLILSNLEKGAFGVSAGLDYKPAYFATTDEVVSVLEPARKWRTFFPNHDRVTPESGFSSRAGVEETRRIGERAGLVPEYTHMKVQGHEQGSGSIVIGMMTAASKDGRWVAADAYPYLAGQTGLGALIIPGWAQDGGTEAMRARFKDPALRAKIIAESDAAIKARFNGAESIIVAGGRKLSDIMQQNGSATPGEAIVKVLETETPSAILGFGIEADLVKIFQYHSTAVACDCGATTQGRAHPRYFGTFPRVLGRYVREQRALTWEDAVRKMSGLPAAMMGLVDRGLIQPGMAADIAVFDSATVIDHATYEKPDAPSDGIRHVLVNGTIALRDGVATGERGGTVLRRSGNMPSRPMSLAAGHAVTINGAVKGFDGAARGRVTISLKQGAGARRATGTVTLTAADGTVLRATEVGVLQTSAGWASITGVFGGAGQSGEKSFTLIIEKADPFRDGAGPTLRLLVPGAEAVEGSLDKAPAIS